MNWTLKTGLATAALAGVFATASKLVQPVLQVPGDVIASARNGKLNSQQAQESCRAMVDAINSEVRGAALGGNADSVKARLTVKAPIMKISGIDCSQAAYVPESEALASAAPALANTPR